MDYPGFLRIERQSEPVEHGSGLLQIELRITLAENHKVVGVAHDVASCLRPL